MNSWNSIGRLTKDPKLEDFNGTKVATFTLAVNRKYDREKADFIFCKAFNKTAELLDKFVKKGHRVACEGRIQSSSYEKDGKTIFSTDVIIDNVEFLESKSQASNDEKSQASNDEKSPKDFDEPNEDDLPF